MSQLLALLQGKESLSTITLTREYVEAHYQEAVKLYTAGYIAQINPLTGKYRIVHHAQKWTRRVR